MSTLRTLLLVFDLRHSCPQAAWLAFLTPLERTYGNNRIVR